MIEHWKRTCLRPSMRNHVALNKITFACMCVKRHQKSLIERCVCTFQPLTIMTLSTVRLVRGSCPFHFAGCFYLHLVSDALVYWSKFAATSASINEHDSIQPFDAHIPFPACSANCERQQRQSFFCVNTLHFSATFRSSDPLKQNLGNVLLLKQ